jgi:hypothetical protein
MAGLPQHPDGDDAVDDEQRPTGSHRGYLWWALGLGLLVIMVVLHLTGVLGPGSNG